MSKKPKCVCDGLEDPEAGEPCSDFQPSEDADYCDECHHHKDCH